MNTSATAQESIARGTWSELTARLGRWITHDVLALLARVSIAAIFLQSGRTKVDGWLNVTDSAVSLFRDEYRLPLLSPELAAHAAAYAEHLFPLLLIAGLLSRLSAAALLGMTLVIEVFVYPDAWATHLSWAVPLLYVLGRGPGRVSLDRMLRIDG